MSYKFIFGGGLSNSYFFETFDGVIYQIKFKPTPYLFGEQQTEISENVFEFSILVEFNPNPKLSAADKKIGKTAVAIFLDFYQKNGNSISVYICDSSDGKQLIRKRKFDQFFKIDEFLVDKKNNRFPISLILSKSNPYRLEIFEAFLEMSINNKK